jgi:hypothetical protein
MDGEVGRAAGVHFRRGGVGASPYPSWTPSTTVRVVDPTKEEEVLRVSQESMKAKVMRVLSGSAVGWIDSHYPCLTSLEGLTVLLRGVNHTTRESILRPPPPQTMLEGRQGAKLVIDTVYDCPVADMATFFAEQVLPTRFNPDSRKEYDRDCPSFVTYDIAFDTLDDIFPTNLQLLHGYISHLLTFQYAITIVKHLSAVVSRNRDYGHILLRHGDMKRYTDSLKG